MSALRGTAELLPPRSPRVGELVEVRSRRWLVEAVEDADPEASARVSLACADDERTDEESEAEEAAQISAINGAAEAGAGPAAADARAEAIWHEEKALLARMEEVASAARGLPDAKTRYLIDWIREHLCPGLPPWAGEPPPGSAGFQPAASRRLAFGGASHPPGPSLHGEGPAARLPRWNDRRVLVFTENVIGTKRYLRTMLEQAIAGTDLAEERIETIDGQTVGAKRKEIQRRFNTDPARDPLRILIATDAAREGLNFQAHCTDLFHFDLPWNPGRIEQRNGRIDRKLQPAPAVRCHYFVLPQRTKDRVLDVLVKKTETIRYELGSLSKVIDDDIERRLRRGGIRHGNADRLAREIETADLDREMKRVAAEELEAARERQEDLKAQIERCRGLPPRARRAGGTAASRNAGEPARTGRGGARQRGGGWRSARARVQRRREAPARSRHGLLAHPPRPVRPRPRN